MRKMTRALVAFSIVVWMSQCRSHDQSDRLTEIKDSIRMVYAPDKRVALFDISVDFDEDKYILKGESDQPEALKALDAAFEQLDVKYSNQISILPDSSVGGMNYAIVNNSVANIRSDSRHSAELATQALLGMELKVLKRLEEWYLVQTPDQYISWVDHGGVQLVTDSAKTAWDIAPQIIYMKNYGNVYLDREEQIIVSDIVLGGRLVKQDEFGDHIQVAYPDGRLGFVRKSEVMDFEEWRAQVQPSGDLVIEYAKSQLGSPYLWGGTSSKGMDCSGFTKTAYLMNGYVIPRDASQQVNAGEVVDPDFRFAGLQKGDLLFFGRSATDSTLQRVTHVGLWMGDSCFIHSAMQVRISSIDPESPDYDEFNKNRYLGSRRYLGNEKGIWKWD